jgi:predicted ribosomally synthesized peptide with nif11-like leader
MSKAGVLAFFERLKKDQEFAKTIAACRDEMAFLAAAKAAGFEFTRAEVAEMKRALSDKDLDGITGGCGGNGGCGGLGGDGGFGGLGGNGGNG